MNDLTASEPGSTKPCASFPLAGIRFLQLGTSRVGDRLRQLLADQGARRIGSESSPGAADARADLASVDVVIDDRTEVHDAARDSSAYRSANPRVVYVKFTDFARSHPRWTGESRLLDVMLHAELGLNRADTDGVDPEPLAIASSYGAIWGALFVAAALARRDADGTGADVELPLFSMALTVLARKLQSMADPELVDPMAMPHLPTMNLYRCGDGRYVQINGSFPPFAEATVVAFGRDDWRKEAAAALMSLPSREAEDEWRARLGDQFLRRGAAECETAIVAAGGACTMSRTRDEWMATAHSREARLLVSGSEGEPATPSGVRAGPAVRLAKLRPPAGNPGRATARAQPGAASAGVAPDATRPPLAGVRVVDFSIILAGPTCGRTLAEFGADVVKVDTPNRVLNNTYGWIDVNRGKRSLLVDFKQPAGREIVLRLIGAADVVLENLRAGKMERAGLGFEDVARLRPGIVYGSFNAFDYGGSWSRRPGWEHNAQAATGMQTARARNGAPRMVPVPVNDYSTGLLGAFGLMLGLREARTSGTSVHVTGSLARSAVFIQTEDFAGETRREPRTETRRCADGWIRVALDDSTRRGARAGAEGAIDVKSMRCVDAAAALLAQGIHATVERTFADLKADPWLEEAGHLVGWTHRHWGALKQVFAAPAASDIAVRPGWPASDPGDDSLSILDELGYAAGEVGRLVADGVVAARKPLWPHW